MISRSLLFSFIWGKVRMWFAFLVILPSRRVFYTIFDMSKIEYLNLQLKRTR